MIAQAFLNATWELRKNKTRAIEASRLITARGRGRPETRHPQDFVLPTFPRRIGARKILSGLPLREQSK